MASETGQLGFTTLPFHIILKYVGLFLCRAYLQAGITVWLDVPIEDLAKRVTAVGTESRPLLGGECGAYDEALSRLSKLLVDRGPHYQQANCRLSLQGMLFLHAGPLSDLTAHTVGRQWLIACGSEYYFVSTKGVTGFSINRGIVQLSTSGKFCISPI